MVDLFKEVLPSIMVTKKPVITEENEKEYAAYTINRALSYHIDCVLYANEMNRYPGVDALLQYHYYINTIRATKRPFQRWQKLDKSENLEAVKEYYNFSTEKAKAALDVLSDEHLENIKKNLTKGGISNAKSRKSSVGDTP